MKVAGVPRAKSIEDHEFSAIDPRIRSKSKAEAYDNLDKIEVVKQKSRKPTEKAGGYKVKKLNAENMNIQFNIESYLDPDKINEIINIESLEKTLDDVLTISDEEMNRLMGCSGNDSISHLGKLVF